MGNYDSFGNKKFFPELDIETFEEILKTSSAYNDFHYTWNCIKYTVYDDSPSCLMINLPENNGKNYYYMGDIKLEDIKKVDDFLMEKEISLLNTRLIKLSQNKFAYLVASVDQRTEVWEENTTVVGYYGNFFR